MKVIDTKGIYYQQLNKMIKEAFKEGETEITLNNVQGQRYIGDGITGDGKIIINGTPGNDMHQSVTVAITGRLTGRYMLVNIRISFAPSIFADSSSSSGSD